MLLRALALVCLAGLVATVPVNKDLAKAESLIQSLAPVVQGADDVKRMQLLNALRDTILPLSEVVVSRLTRVQQFESSELAPLQERAKSANTTIQTLEQRINEIHAQLAQLPKQTHVLIQQRDDALSSMDVANQTRTRIAEEGSQQLKTLQTQMDQARADTLLLNKLVEWLDTTLPNWDETESLIEMNKLVSGLSEQFLAQISNTSDASDLSTPAAIKRHVESMRDAARSESERLSVAYNTLNTHMAEEQTRLTSEIAQHEKSYNAAIAGLSEVDHQQRVLTDTFSTHSLQLRQTQEDLTHAQHSMHDIVSKWSREKEELVDLKNTIQTIIVLLPHA